MCYEQCPGLWISKTSISVLIYLQYLLSLELLMDQACVLAPAVLP